MIKKSLIITLVISALLLNGSLAHSPGQTEDEFGYWVGKNQKSEAQKTLDKYIGVHHGSSDLEDEFHPMKIHASVENLEKKLAKDYPELLKYMTTRVIPSAIKHVEATLKVREKPSVTVPHDKISWIKTPSYLYNKEMKTDLVIIFDVITNPKIRTLGAAAEI
jgi:hypothetical protein